MWSGQYILFVKANTLNASRVWATVPIFVREQLFLTQWKSYEKPRSEYDTKKMQTVPWNGQGWRQGSSRDRVAVKAAEAVLWLLCI